jgi:hypothetical protein
MSKPYVEGRGQAQVQEPLVWERVTWRQGDGRYTFEVAEGGLHATLSSPHGTSLTLPSVAWDGLLDALTAARKTRQRGERAFPPRSGARWYDGETGELVAGFRAGRTIPELARAHNRTEFAVEAQLERMGLWDRVAQRSKAGGQDLGGPRASLPDRRDGDVAHEAPVPLRWDRG